MVKEVSKEKKNDHCVTNDRGNDLYAALSHAAPSCLICFLLALLISGASFDGRCFVAGVSFVASVGGGLHGVCALVGICIGYPLLYGFDSTVHYVAAGIFVYTTAYICQYTRLYRSTHFLPFVVMIVLSLIRAFGAVNVIRGEASLTSALLLEAVLGGALTYLYAVTMRRDIGTPDSSWKLYSAAGILSTIFMSLSSVRICGSISVVKIAAAAIYMLMIYRSRGRTSYPIALMFGLALQYSTVIDQKSLLLYLLYSLSDMYSDRISKFCLSTHFFGASAILVVIFGPNEALMLQMIETTIGVLLFILFANIVKSREENSNESMMTSKVQEADKLLALANLMRNISSTPEGTEETPIDEDISMSAVFDRAVEQVCGKCDKKALCWTNHLFDMVSVFEESVPNIQQRGKMQDNDLPDYFTYHCDNHPSLVLAVNYELLRAYDARTYAHDERSFTKTLSHQLLCFSDILAITASKLREDKSHKRKTTEFLRAEIGIASMKKTGEPVCGDCTGCFKTEQGVLYIILSDGVGTGSRAEQYSSLVVSIVEQTLQILDDPVLAIEMVNTVLRLQSRNVWGYATVDIVAVNLSNGATSFYKLGAADSYIITEQEIKVIPGNAYSAGSEESGGAATYQSFILQPNTVIVLASDGAALSECPSLLNPVMQCCGNMKAVAKNILLAVDKDGSDDKTVITLSLTKR